jgi:hypothetical protein
MSTVSATLASIQEGLQQVKVGQQAQQQAQQEGQQHLQEEVQQLVRQMQEVASARQTTHYWLNKMKQSPIVDGESWFESVDSKILATCWTAAKEILASSNFHTANTRKESQVQDLMTQVHLKVLSLLKTATPLVLRDTHRALFPLQPQHKIDHLFVKKDAPSAEETVQVSWFDIVTFEELKSDFCTTSFTQSPDGLHLQVVDRFRELFAKQPNRAVAYALVGCGSKLQFFRMERSGSTTSSEQLNFLCDTKEITRGFLLYVRFLCTNPVQLGFGGDTTTVPADVLAALDCSNLTLLRNGFHQKPDVFAVDYLAQKACLKIYKMRCMMETELKVLQALDGSGAPKVLSTADSSLAMLVVPLASQTLATALFAPSLLVSALSSLVKVLAVLDEYKWAYVDPSPSNVLVTDDGVVVWNDYADVIELDTVLSEFRGTHAFCSLGMKGLACGTSTSYTYTRKDDLQAIFFTLLAFAVHSLPWMKETTRDHMLAKKTATVLDNAEWKLVVLPHSTEPFFNTLRHLLFFDEEFDYKQCLRVLSTSSFSTASAATATVPHDASAPTPAATVHVVTTPAATDAAAANLSL